MRIATGKKTRVETSRMEEGDLQEINPERVRAVEGQGMLGVRMEARGLDTQRVRVLRTL